jgi:hypothetical protein
VSPPCFRSSLVIFSRNEYSEESCYVSWRSLLPMSPRFLTLCSLTASALFAYFLGLLFRSRLIGLENHVFIAAVTVVCATVLLLVLWNGRRDGSSSSSKQLDLRPETSSSSTNKPASSGCCGGGCRSAAAASDTVACCQDNSDSVSIASSVGSHKGMSKEAFHKWKRDNPDE